MKPTEIRQAIINALTDVMSHEGELGELDAALGDGDLGVTVAAGAKAVIAALESLPESASTVDIARACASAFADANPSTMAALVAGGLLAGSKVWDGVAEVTHTEAADFLAAAAESISKRGRSQVGDKTILDAIYPAVTALRAGPDGSAGLDAAIDAAERAVNETKDMQSQRGRASWLQERSIGLQDPGATAFWYFLRSWKTSN